MGLLSVLCCYFHAAITESPTGNNLSGFLRGSCILRLLSVDCVRCVVRGLLYGRDDLKYAARAPPLMRYCCTYEYDQLVVAWPYFSGWRFVRFLYSSAITCFWFFFSVFPFFSVCCAAGWLAYNLPSCSLLQLWLALRGQITCCICSAFSSLVVYDHGQSSSLCGVSVRIQPQCWCWM